MKEGINVSKIDGIWGMRQAIEEDPRWVSVISDCMQRLGSGFYPQDFVNAIFQSHSLHNRHVDMDDAFIFAKVWCFYIKGQIYRIDIPIGELPGKNKDIEGNNRILSTLPPYLQSKFIPETGMAADDDGYFKWKIPLDFLCEIDDEVRTIPPRSIPLEVGSTNAVQTYYHLFIHSGVARWPYGSDNIMLLYASKEFRKAHILPFSV